MKTSIRNYDLIFLVILIAISFIQIKSDNTTNGSTSSTSSTVSTSATTLTTSSITTTLTSSSSSTSKSISGECKLSKASEHETSLLAKLNILKGEKYTWNDTDHAYYFTICSRADNSRNENEGFLQINRKTGKSFVLGRLDDVDLEGLDGTSN